MSTPDEEILESVKSEKFDGKFSFKQNDTEKIKSVTSSEEENTQLAKTSEDFTDTGHNKTLEENLADSMEASPTDKSANNSESRHSEVDLSMKNASQGTRDDKMKSSQNYFENSVSSC